MPFSSYAELKDAIQRWGWRDGGDNAVGDTTFIAAIPDMIALAEARINQDLRVPQMDQAAALVLTDGVADLPDDYLAMRSARYGSQELRSISPTLVSSAYTPDYLNAYSVYGGKFRVHSISDGPLTIEYRARVPALSDANPTNWLLEQSPDVYLRASLVEAADWMDDTEAVARQGALYQNAVGRLNENGVRYRYPQPAKQPRGWAP